MIEKIKSKFFIIHLVLIWLVFPGWNAFAQAPDTLLTQSGDQLIGKVKSMSKSVLVFGTAYSDADFRIEWKKIRGLSTGRAYIVQDQDGNIYDCLIRFGSRDSLVLQTSLARFKKAFPEIVEIRPIYKELKDLLDLDIHFGYTFTKSDNTHQLVLRSNIRYRGKKWNLAARINSFNTIRSSISSRRVDANLDGRYNFGHNWYLFSIVDLLSSEELSLDLRTTTSLGVGNYLVRTNDFFVFVLAGATFNNEVFDRSESLSQRSAEIVFGGEAELFGIRKFSLLSQFYAFPSVTESQRVRLNSHLDLTWDLYKKFDLKLGFSLNYDNRPLEEGENLDYVFSLTLGWAF